MGNSALRVLHVEDDFADAILVQNACCEAGDFDIEFEVARTLKDAKRKLGQGGYHLVLLDLRLPDSLNPSDTLETAMSACGDIPVMVLSGSMSVDLSHLPSDIPSFDKNASLSNMDGSRPVHLAAMIREAADGADTLSI